MINDDQLKDDLLKNITAREHEIYGYQTNIDTYTTIISGITATWCINTEEYKNLNSQQIVECVPTDLQTLVADLNFKESLKKTLTIEKLEQRKAIHVLNALRIQLSLIDSNQA